MIPHWVLGERGTVTESHEISPVLAPVAFHVVISSSEPLSMGTVVHRDTVTNTTDQETDTTNIFLFPVETGSLESRFGPTGVSHCNATPPFRDHFLKDPVAKCTHAGNWELGLLHAKSEPVSGAHTSYSGG